MPAGMPSHSGHILHVMAPAPVMNLRRGHPCKNGKTDHHQRGGRSQSQYPFPLSEVPAQPAINPWNEEENKDQCEAAVKYSGDPGKMFDSILPQKDPGRLLPGEFGGMLPC